MYRNGTHFYSRTNVMTADPKRLVLMCYEGAIDSLKIGKQRLAEKDYEGKTKAFIAAQDIVNELLCALDYQKGGSIAKSLDSLYNFMLRRIAHADLTKDVKAIDEVIGMLGELKLAWEQIFYGREKEVSPQEVSSDDQGVRALGFVST
jgi:flagellar protein FliS